MPFIDVVYKLQDVSIHDDLELRYSLRSLINFSHIRNVYIVGHKPSWVTNVIHVDVQDHFSLKNKDANIINKLIAVCCKRELSEWFLNMSDDQVFLKETPVSYFNVPIYNNSIRDNPERFDSANYFHQRLMRTLEVLRANKYPDNCYETHTPYLLNKYEYPEIMMKYDYMHGLGFCGNTLYFNTKNEIGQSKVGINHVYRLQKQSDIITPDVSKFQFFNYNNYCETPETFNFLEKMFNKKSNYEK